MNGKRGKNFRVVPFEKNRKIILDLLEQGKKRNHVKALVEVDVTDAREFFKRYKEIKGEKLSFTAWIIYCVAKAIDENIEVNAYRKGRRKIVIFDEVDVGTIIEREIEGKKIPRKYIIRGANRKSLIDIHNEIRDVQRKEISGPILGNKKETKFVNIFASLPKFIRKIFWWWTKQKPEFRKKMLGTITVSSVGMCGRTGGWGIVISSETVHVMIGGIARKPGVVGDEISIREYLDLTLMADHSIIDGGPIARLLQRLIDLIESSYGLDDNLLKT